MITIESLAAVPERLRGGFVAVGNFDGVHRGHARLIARLKGRANARGASAVALTFDPPPAAVLRPDSAPTPLTWIERRAELLRAAGADEVGVFRTGRWLLGLTAREFFDRVILGQFAARGMVEGPTFGFGRDRLGDATILKGWAAEAGLDFEIAEPTEIDGQVVSSSRIRHALAEGRVEEAGRLLGRPHRLRGIVARGAGRGADLGFPTANLEHVDVQIPADGVYAAAAQIDGVGPSWLAAVHIGPNATFGEQARTVEAHLLDFQGNLYGRRLELDLRRHLRPTRRFDSVADLLDQIRADVDRARRLDN